MGDLLTSPIFYSAIVLLVTSPITIPLFNFGKNRISAYLAHRGWQAFFLSNGQVYFGKITSINSSELTITHIYYLKDKGATPSILDKNVPSHTLVKLGNEPHGPKDKMVINRQHIVFWENLKDEGKIVKAIKSLS